MDERQYFGRVNTAYDFQANDPKEASRKVQKLEQTKEKLSRSVNMRAMTMLGKAEEQVGMASVPHSFISSLSGDLYRLLTFPR